MVGYRSLALGERLFWVWVAANVVVNVTAIIAGISAEE